MRAWTGGPISTSGGCGCRGIGGRESATILPMATLVSQLVREVFRRELIPTRLRWWFVAEGMCDWYAVLGEQLAPHLGGERRAQSILSEISVPMFTRRHQVLGSRFPAVARAAIGPTMSGLYRVASYPT